MTVHSYFQIILIFNLYIFQFLFPFRHFCSLYNKVPRLLSKAGAEERSDGPDHERVVHPVGADIRDEEDEEKQHGNDVVGA